MHSASAPGEAQPAHPGIVLQFPSALTEPVKQQPRRGRYPAGVVNLRLFALNRHPCYIAGLNAPMPTVDEKCAAIKRQLDATLQTALDLNLELRQLREAAR